MKIPQLGQWEPVLIEWIDSTGSVEDWEEVPAAGQSPYEITTVGQVYAQGDDSLTLVFSWVESTQIAGGYITVPTIAITRLKRLH